MSSSHFRQSGRSIHAQLLRLVEEFAADCEQDNGIHAAAVLAKHGDIIATGRDRTVPLNDPIAVAVADCYRNAGRRSDQRELDLYCAPAPDMLGAGIIIQFGVGVLYVRERLESSAVLRFLHAHRVSIVSLTA